MCSPFSNIKTLADIRALSDVPIEPFSVDQVGQDSPLSMTRRLVTARRKYR